MALQGGLFSSTLQDITNNKLDDLAQYRQAFEQRRSAVLEEVQKETDVIRKVTRLADGVKSCFSIQTVDDGRVHLGATSHKRLEVDLKNLDRFITQAQCDPSVSTKVLEQWYSTLMKHLDIQSTKYTFASLYGGLTTEWLAREKSSTPDATGEDTKMGDYEQLPGAKKLESRANWERSVFEAAEVDADAISTMLEDLFHPAEDDSRDLRKATLALKRRVQDFSRDLSSPWKFNQTSLRWVISGLLASDLLTDEKRSVLRDFESNELILKEIADVLNMRMASLSSWTWGNEVQLEERRQVNGSMRIFMHEELLQAIFLQFIGVSWSVFWKGALLDFRIAPGVWKNMYTELSEVEQMKRDRCLNRTYHSNSILDKLEKIHMEQYFCAQLLHTEAQEVQALEGQQEAQFEPIQPDASNAPPQMYQLQGQASPNLMFQQTQTATQRAPHAMQEGRRTKTSMLGRRAQANHMFAGALGGSHQKSVKSPMELRQNLLHILAAEIQIKTRYGRDLTSFRSQINNLYATLPHATVERTLRFFGVPEIWISFFKKFLQAPLRFMDEKDAKPRLRQRGTPGSHVLSEVFSELTLFCLDFRINQVTDGGMLWRLHDDLWFWSTDYNACVKAWYSAESFIKTMGLSLDQARTGSAHISQVTKPEKVKSSPLQEDSRLPSGQIRWGMLVLNPETRRFEIDQALVDKHILELSRQLQDKNKSIFSFVQVWNVYARTFFSSNFGSPVTCFGRQHVDDMLETHKRIQRKVFTNGLAPKSPEGTGSVVQFLKDAIHERFEVSDIPDGYIFLPTELGGLDLQSSFVGLLQIRDALPQDPSKLLEDFEEAEREAYRRNKQQYNLPQRGLFAGTRSQEPKEPFMSFEEFTRYREEFYYGYENEFSDVFSKLLRKPAEESLDCEANSTVMNGLKELEGQSGLRGILSSWPDMEPYWKWICQLYGPEIIETFGGFRIVDAGLLPMGMVSLFRSGRVKWQD